MQAKCYSVMQAGAGAEEVRKCLEKSELLALAKSRVNTWEVCRLILSAGSLVLAGVHMNAFSH